MPRWLAWANVVLYAVSEGHPLVGDGLVVVNVGIPRQERYAPTVIADAHSLSLIRL